MSQPVPPSFKDLGKSAGDLLGRDIPIGVTTFELKTIAPSNVAFKVAGVSDNKSNVINGDIEGKYTDFSRGLTFTQAWTTTNLLKTQVELENQIAKGLKIDVASVLNPAKGSKSVIVNGAFKQPSLHSRASLDLFKGPSVSVDTVVGRDGFLVGGEVGYDVGTGAISRYSAGVGYSAPEYAITIHALQNLSTFSASYYHKVSKDVEVASKAVYNTKSTTGDVGVEVGLKHYLDNSSFYKIKLSNAGVFGAGFTQALRPGVKVSLGLALDTARLNDTTAGTSAHKVGAAFTFNA
ncbi:voltage-dependent anion channel protein 2, partial [Tremellales sp. Uapishka_1]